jgi:hypothetical protein
MNNWGLKPAYNFYADNSRQNPQHAGKNLTNQYDVRGLCIFTGNYNDIDFNKTLNFRGGKTQGTIQNGYKFI